MSALDTRPGEPPHYSQVWTFTAIDRYEYDSAGAILLIVILVVMIAEYASGYLRKFLQ